MPTLIDLSIFIENEIVSDPEGYRPKIHYINHRESMPDDRPQHRRTDSG